MFFVLCFIKTQPFVTRKPVKTGGKNTGTIAFRFRQALPYMKKCVKLVINKNCSTEMHGPQNI